jgi:hypothetical protein
MATSLSGHDFLADIPLTSLQPCSYMAGIRPWHRLCREYNVAVFKYGHIWKQQNEKYMNTPEPPKSLGGGRMNRKNQTP